MNDVIKQIERFFVRHRDRFPYVHAVMFVVFAILILVPPFLPVPAEGAAILDDISLMARFIVWGVWFPLVLLSVVFLGRFWCGVLCPQGALAEHIGKKGLNRPLPKWLRWEGTPVISFIAVTALGQLTGVRDYPLPTLEILGGTMLAAVLVGFLYASGRRPWCRYLCPIGPLLGIFARLGAPSFERNGAGAGRCACPTFINTANKVSSSACIECFRCVAPDGSMRLTIRRPGLEIEEIEKREPGLFEAAFLFMATGLALGAFHWQANPAYIRYKQVLGSLLLYLGVGEFMGKGGPWWIMAAYPEAGEAFNRLDVVTITTFMLICMACVACSLFTLTALSAFISGGKDGLMTRATRLGYLYAPVALISLVIGLGLPLFQSLASLGAAKGAVRMTLVILFVAGSAWSGYLAIRLNKGRGVAALPNFIGIGLVATAWHSVLF
ncbi:MAG: 4Fe-4S binding protein [Deltaproteobacteria bacterium]|nr:4Fe-4S binding protein [Deltaproteobacteria bacterium]